MKFSTGASTLLGRELELRILSEAVRQAADGSGGIVALAGEPGIGKSRLALATADRATELGLTVAWGYCNEHSGAPPFWPWVQTLGDLIDGAGVDTARDWVSQANRRVLQLLPALANPGDGPDTQQSDPAQAEFELLNSTAQLILNASRHKPLCIILEDLHWADHSTLSLLKHLGSELSRNQILVIGTYRDVEVSRTHPLADTLSELQRHSGFHRVPVRPLNSEAAFALLSEVAGGEQTESTANAVLERADGNPLFILEIARELAHRDYRMDDIRIPEGIRDAIGQRLNRLSGSTTDILGLAALAGRKFSFDLMRLVVPDLEPARILGNLEEAVDLSIIEELPGRHGIYRFSHALVQQTLISELSLTRQVRHHSRIAESMERMLGATADANASLLSHHFRRAETILGPEKALYYSMLAGEQAISRSAYADARTHFQAALEINGGVTEDLTLAEILYGLGRTSTPLHGPVHHQQGWDNLAKSFDIFVSLGQTQKAIDIAKYPFIITSISNVPYVTSRALELVEPGTVDHGWVLARHGVAIGDLGENDEAIWSLEEAIKIALQHGDERLQCRALAHLAQSHARNDEPEACLEIAAKCKALARKIVDPMSEFRLIKIVSQSALMVGDLTLAKSANQDFLELHDRISGPEHSVSATATLSIMIAQWQIARSEGNMSAAGGLTGAMEEDLANSEAERNRLVRFTVAMDAGSLPDDPDLFHIFESLLTVQFEEYVHWIALPAAASLAGHRGSFGERERKLLALCTRVLENARRTAQPHAENRFYFLSYDAMFATALGDKDRAGDLYAQLAPKAGWVSPFSGIDVNRSLGRLATLNGNDQLALDHFEKAMSECRDRGYVLELGWSCHDFAVAALRMGNRDTEAVRSALKEGLEIAERCGLEHLGESLRLRLGGQASAQHPAGLSNREVDVLRLVAGGLSNGRIAEQLVISPHTVNRHLNNLFSKLGVTSRAAATDKAHRLGIV